MATQKLTLGDGARLWWGRKAIKVTEIPVSGWGATHDRSVNGIPVIQIEGENGGRILELTKEDARQLSFTLFDLTEDPKYGEKPAES